MTGLIAHPKFDYWQELGRELARKYRVTEILIGFYCKKTALRTYKMLADAGYKTHLVIDCNLGSTVTVFINTRK